MPLFPSSRRYSRTQSMYVGLEEQNERLRVQNLRCAAQLKVLKSCADRSKHWQQSLLFSHSVTGVLPVTMMDRASDDSGLTSDDTWERKTDLMTHSASALYRNASMRTPKKSARVREASQTREHENSSTTDSSPWEEKSKPIPTPRKSKPKTYVTIGTVERDSLNSDDDENEYRDDDEIFDEVEYPQSSHEKDFADYVNLNEMYVHECDMKSAPTPPVHRPPNQWETKLYQVADQCLSTILSENEGVNNCGTMSKNPPAADNTSDLCSSPSRRSEQSSLSSKCHRSDEFACSTHEIEYAVPPDTSHDFRATMVASSHPIEKSGYLIQMSDSRLKSLKRRFFILRDSQITMFRTQKNSIRGEEPLARISISEVRSVTKISGKMGNGLQISTADCDYCYMGDSDRTTDEWFNALNQSIRAISISDVCHRAAALNSQISGYVLRTKYASTKRFFASVVDGKLLFFRNAEDRIPCSYLMLKGSLIREKMRNSSEEYSGSSDEQTEEKDFREGHFAVSIETAGNDPVYVVLRNAEEMDKWIYYLKKAAGDASICGTPFEVLLQRMMTESAAEENALWKDVLLTSCEETPTDTLTTIDDDDDGSVRKKALDLARACYMFTAVLMRPTGVQYHVDLAQNILSTTLHNEMLKNELYAHLVKLTSGSMPYALQAWKLLALTLPLFTPKQYALFWLLRRHIQRWSSMSGDEANMARFCATALDRCLKSGGRVEGPSKLEAISVLTRDPSSTKMPHSIPVLLPNGEYHVIDFDGSTDIGDCLSALCVRCALRPALLSGYALYAEDVSNEGCYILLKGRQKLCDCLARWERERMDSRSGRVTEEIARIRLCLRLRQYWSHLVALETPNERTFLVHRMAKEIVAGRVPVSTELAEELASVYSQMKFGDIEENISDERFQYITSNYYPAKLLDVCPERTLRLNIMTHWKELKGMAVSDCVRVILVVLRKWKFFGAYITEAKMKMRNDDKVFIALNDQGVHLLTYKQLEVIRSFPYHRLVSFGGYHNDFMLTIDRVLPPGAHPEETARERLTFMMPLKEIDQLTCHLAEYIRCRKLVWKISSKKM